MTIGQELPRPAAELEELKRIWAPPKGVALLSAVNNNIIGSFYIATAFLFFLLGGILALLIRTQLAVPENDFLDAGTYNQIFTVHGTVMMFLFAVPMIEAVAVYLLPAMLAARDLPFPRLSAYAYWAYAVGGLVFFSSLFFGVAPDGGWFMYPPLTGPEFSPGINSDFWLLGIGFIEISALAGAIELIVGVLRTRAPGMSVDKMPIFAWTMLVVGFMIIFGFPPVILGTALLEMERAFGWPFFDADAGGDPLLWQHLFWLFGHPEVYIIFLPAAGLVSMIVPTMARVPLVGYSWVVVALVATGFFSFGLWVHHMYATGIPHLSLSFFSAASMAVVIPSGIQVFAWIATLGAGRPRIATPTLFIIGFLFIFVLGGLTGVMVATVPFDWQVHDTHFVVAHLHYVLIGGMVFPLFAAFYYWMPNLTGRMLSEALGRWVFWLMFIGFNTAFFPLHFAGLRGMPRRIYTYPEDLGWNALNLVSSIGAFVLAAGVLLFLVDFALHFFRGRRAGDNPWGAGSLEWLPQSYYATRSIPLVRSREPLWDHPALPQEVAEGAHFLPGAPTGERETIVTSPIDAQPQYLMRMPGPSWWPPLGALGTAAFFILLTVKLVIPALVGGVVAILAILAWMWQTDRVRSGDPIDIGYGMSIPRYVQGRASHSIWATAILLMADAAAYLSLVFGYFFLWTVTPGAWPPVDLTLPDPLRAFGAGVLYVASAVIVLLAYRAVLHGRSIVLLMLGLPIAFLLAAGAFGVDLMSWLSTGLRPAQSGYAAIVYMFIAYQGFHMAVLLVMALYAVARCWRGLVAPDRLVTIENIGLFWLYACAQGATGLLVGHLAPRLL